jgi:hypothetical protein
MLCPLFLQPTAAKANENEKAGPITARAALEDALAQSVDAYKNLWQTIGTAPYNSNSEALDIVLGCDGFIEAAAEKHGVDKAVLQAILFQELRFVNIFDEVDICVENTYRFLHEKDAQDAAPLLSVSIIEPVMTGLYVSDSSTGLGQIYAETAIKALNWDGGTRPYNYDDWNDREEIWLRLKYDETFNIDMIGLICRYNAYILTTEKYTENPSVRDILRIYNGWGPSAERYADAAYRYYEAFRQYNKAASSNQ